MAARRLGIPHIELDAMYHRHNWTQTPTLEFRHNVSQLVARDAWVIDGNYGIVRDLIWQRATSVAWIDPPHPVIMAQVFWRSFSRAITKKELWNGNREEFYRWLDPDHPIRWAWRTHKARQAEFLSAMGPNWVRLRSRQAITAWLATLSPLAPLAPVAPPVSAKST
jgi:adenylate kinase family enzyme